VDTYWYADMTQSELSRETVLPTRPVVRECYTPGAAANVAWNLADLGVKSIYAVTIVGQDWRWKIMHSLLRDIGVDVEHVLESEDWATTMYAKPVLMAHGLEREDARLDFLSDHPLAYELEETFLAEVRSVLPKVDVVTLSDQVTPGIFTNRGIAALAALAEKHPEVTFVADSRHRISAFRHMVIKPNSLEAARALFPHQIPKEITQSEIADAAPRLYDVIGRPVYVTLGEQGVLICNEGEVRHIPGVPLLPPIDVVGAGDTFLATLAASLAAGTDCWEAGVLANLAAAIVCKKLNQTGTAPPDEIWTLYDTLLHQDIRASATQDRKKCDD